MGFPSLKCDAKATQYFLYTPTWEECRKQRDPRGTLGNEW